jgi:prepilin-type N-terminal cleavage/methylation domain-containing protein
MRHARACRGFSLLELAVVVTAVAIVAGVLLDRVLPLIGRAQRAAFLAVQRDLESSVRLAAAERIANGESGVVLELVSANPMSLLLQPPGNYLGVLAAREQASVPPASWYFDEQTRRLGYKVGRYARFVPRGGPRDRIELRIAFVYEDRDADGVFDPAGGDGLAGHRLEPVHPYEWPD